MLLLIDAGNTRIKWALAASGTAAGEWLASGVLSQSERDGLAEQWHGLDIDAALVSNVAGPEAEAAIAAQLQAHGARYGTCAVRWFRSVASLAGVRNRYHDPASLGCDRFASLIGARALHPGQALIVATGGTATTVDALDARGDFIGGMILPGLGLMAASLARRTAQLPHITAPVLPSPGGASALFADNTQDAIHNGCLAAQAGAIERAVAAHGGAPCLLSGGAAAWIAPHLSVPFTLVENLVLIGLHAASRAPAGDAASPNHIDTTGADRPC